MIQGGERVLKLQQASDTGVGGLAQHAAPGDGEKHAAPERHDVIETCVNNVLAEA